MENMDIDPKTLALKRGLFGGEPWDDAMGEMIQTRLYIEAFDNYGLSEVMGPGVASECPQKSGLHVSEDHFIPEIIDPETGKSLPYGQIGDLVLTTITKEAFPVIRFRTGDMTALHHSRCPCGRSLVRMEKISGRCDDIVIVKGVNVYPKSVGPILKEIAGVEPTYQLVIDRKNNQDVLGIHIEVSEAFFFDKMQKQRALVDQLRKKIRDTLGITPQIILAEAGSIDRGQETAEMVIDRRKQRQ
jgi:phenylacetate-CoA ligase